MPYLRQSTSQIIRFGPFLDSTDGVTAETALTIVQADMQLSKDGGAFAQKNTTGNATHDADGWYSTTLDATDTATVGELYMQVNVSGALPVWVRYWVVEEAIYDDVYGASAGGYLKPTTAGRTLDVTATGAAGIDWGNVENASTAVDLSATDIQLCDTITTYTGNTVQTGDSFARLGAPAGASVSADVADLPTVAEFNARTLASADYFDPAADAVATVTTLTNLPSIPANWLTAAGIAASALDGKGDWNVGKTGYTLTQTFPANFSDLSISLTTGQVSLLTATQASIDAIEADTNELQSDDIPTLIAALPTASEINAEMVDVMEVDTHAQPSSVPAATTTYQNMFTYAFALGRNKMTQTATTTLLRNDADSATIGTSTVSDDTVTFTKGKFV